MIQHVSWSIAFCEGREGVQLPARGTLSPKVDNASPPCSIHSKCVYTTSWTLPDITICQCSHISALVLSTRFMNTGGPIYPRCCIMDPLALYSTSTSWCVATI